VGSIVAPPEEGRNEDGRRLPRGANVCDGVLTRNAAKLTRPPQRLIERPAWLCNLAYTHEGGERPIRHQGD
jgi:hypothetical protein